MKLAILNYLFIFDPSNTGWTSASKFEAQLADFCSAYGIEAEIVETAGSGIKAIYLRNIEPLNQVKNAQNPTTSLKRQVSPQKILKQMTQDNPTDQQARYNKGRFLKTKGYLKRA